jgi:hypothetical protein
MPRLSSGKRLAMSVKYPQDMTEYFLMKHHKVYQLIHIGAECIDRWEGGIFALLYTPHNI